MTQYMLAVHHAGVFPDLPLEECRQSLADTGVFNAKLTDAWFWIISAADLDAALEWARLATVACRVPVEVIPFDERDIDELLAAYPAK
jgi:hypothetical protein